MGALGHRALLQYIESNDLAGFKAFLDTRNLSIDDRDEVRRAPVCCFYGFVVVNFGIGMNPWIQFILFI